MLRHKALIQCARVAFGFSGIYDQDETERIIEGQVVSPETTPGEPSQHAITIAARLIARASEENTWQAALDYTSEKYSGVDLNFILAEINKAKASAEANLLPNATASGASNTATTAANPQESGKGLKGKEALVAAKASLA